MTAAKTSRTIELYVHRNLCKGVDGCGLCMHVCPEDVWEQSEDLTDRGVRTPVAVEPGRCTGCMRCMTFCPDFAVVVKVIRDEDEDA